MKFRTTVATGLAAAAAVLTLGAAPAVAATQHNSTVAVAASARAHSKVTVHSWLTKPYKSVHGTNIYKVGQPFFLYATFSPNKTGHQATVQLQYWFHGSWHAINLGAKAHDPIERGSRTWFGWPNGLNSATTGVKFRVAISYPGDSANRASTVTWHNFEIVN